jgi:hypothetical protein
VKSPGKTWEKPYESMEKSSKDQKNICPPFMR